MKNILLFFCFNLALSSFGQNIPVDFENGGYGSAWTWTCFENNTNPPLEIVQNPYPSGLNPSSRVAKFTALQIGQPWAGCETMHGSDIGTFTITPENHLIRIHVYKTKISNVGIKLVTSSNASLGEILVANTKTNEWEQLTFDFSAHIGGMAYDQLVIFPDFTARTADDIIYFDNIFGEPTYLNIEKTNISSITFSPNPTDGFFRVHTSLPIDTIEIINSLGEKVFFQTQLDKNGAIDISSLITGIYIVKIHQGEQVYFNRINKV